MFNIGTGFVTFIYFGLVPNLCGHNLSQTVFHHIQDAGSGKQ